MHASAADMDEVAQTQVVKDIIVPTRRESVAGSLLSQPWGSHFSREFEEDSNHGVLRVMRELHALLEKQLAIEKMEILGAIKAVSSRVSTLERTLSRCQDADNIVLLNSALPKTRKAAEKASLIDLLRPMEDIFAGKFMCIIFTRALINCTMRFIPQRKEAKESFEGGSRDSQSEKLHLDVNSSEVLGFGLLLVEVFCGKGTQARRPPRSCWVRSKLVIIWSCERLGGRA